MVRPEHAVWSHFFCLYKFEESEDGPKRMMNKSHKAAWCIACFDKITEQSKRAQLMLGEEEDNSKLLLLGSDTHRRLGFRAAIASSNLKPLRGVPKDLIKHLIDCDNVNVKVKDGLTVPGRDAEGGIQNHVPRQTTLKLQQGLHFTDIQKEDFKRDFLRLVVSCNIAFAKADHPTMEDFFTKWTGLAPPSRNTLSGRLLDEEKEAIQSKNIALLASETGGTLICDGWNNSKREHLVSFMLLTPHHSIPLRHFDNSIVTRDGDLAYGQMLEVIGWLKEREIDVYGVCTDDGPD